jgi:hypothetical protein
MSSLYEKLSEFFQDHCMVILSSRLFASWYEISQCAMCDNLTRLLNKFASPWNDWSQATVLWMNGSYCSMFWRSRLLLKVSSRSLYLTLRLIPNNDS